jgi:hypothetical protein
VLLELQSAKKIIELLRAETNSSALHSYANSQGGNASFVSSAINSDREKNTTDIWRIVSYTRRKYNKQPVQQRQPIPTIVNRYTLPNNHHDDSEASQPTGIVGKRASVKIKSTCVSKPRKNKILIIGDSHARGCAAELSSSLDETFEVMCTVVSGSRLEHITSLAHLEISHLHRNDFVVIWGGTNDISRNESDAGHR